MMVIGHRGAAGLAPENTLGAIRKGLELGVQGIEVDVQLTRDGKPVIIHDFSVDRTSNGTGEVANLTLEEIRRLDAGSWFGREFQGERIPTLVEVLETVPPNVMLNLELKQITFQRRGLEEAVAKELKQFGRWDNVVVSSFDHKALETIKGLLEDLRIGLLTYNYLLNPQVYLDSLGFQAYSVHPAFELVDQQDCKAYKERGLKVFCYTVNHHETAREIEALGVDGIFTDRPDLFL
ncbi:glycerophosphoryl diester phosphodiesterase [Thermanaerovibrio velox DSM 12556]|uniref:Glycerophosphoryl diester phosphodiesterase n=1 Tax=Thermanaerovibrio velox DSM 12556 TaxID=926567 RepID=H0UQK6_9BACT|nr:glycerophosphodiester phosphodiesterase [Thermanaerovibrio velox]EHM10770.1 glycerophosphoryl diester phosphodiesterase [Thermanaerovibrio velox DSM 12556]